MKSLKEALYESGSRPCEECGMREIHALDCSMTEAQREPSSYDHDGVEMGLDAKRSQAAGKARSDARKSPYDKDDDGTSCPECGAPSHKKHDPGCPHAGAMDEADDDDLDDSDLDACPGCGCLPGDGVSPECDDPLGCGYWREEHASHGAAEPKGRSMRDMLKSPSSAGDDGVRGSLGSREGFESKDGEWIENPFWDEGGRDEVDPDAHYGDAFKKSGLAKRLRWGESSDYDGLPLNESSMFDRFDTLVGHRADGTFDERESGSTKLHDLIKKVVREAWSTLDPETGEETEHTMDDKDIEDLYVVNDKAKDKKQEARGCVREGDIDEMKLSVAGSAFGSDPFHGDPFSTDDDDEDDDDRLTLRKTPEPEKSGTRVKSKSTKFTKS
jgi:hypothetical protein